LAAARGRVDLAKAAHKTAITTSLSAAIAERGAAQFDPTRRHAARLARQNAEIAVVDATKTLAERQNEFATAQRAFEALP
jgi:hypothetical protein